MWQFFAQAAIYPGAGNGADDTYNNHGSAGSYQGKQWPRAGAGQGPACAKKQAAIYLAFIELFGRQQNRFAVNCFDLEFFDQPYRYNAYGNGRSKNAIHVKALQPEHFLYTKPGYHFGFYQKYTK